MVRSCEIDKVFAPAKHGNLLCKETLSTGSLVWTDGTHGFRSSIQFASGFKLVDTKSLISVANKKERILHVRGKVGEENRALFVAVLRTDSLSVLSCPALSEPVVLLEQKVDGLCRRSDLEWNPKHEAVALYSGPLMWLAYRSGQDTFAMKEVPSESDARITCLAWNEAGDKLIVGVASEFLVFTLEESESFSLVRSSKISFLSLGLVSGHSVTEVASLGQGRFVGLFSCPDRCIWRDSSDLENAPRSPLEHLQNVRFRRPASHSLLAVVRLESEPEILSELYLPEMLKPDLLALLVTPSEVVAAVGSSCYRKVLLVGLDLEKATLQRRSELALKDQQRLRGLAFSPLTPEGRGLVVLASEKASFSLFPSAPSDAVVAMKLQLFPLESGGPGRAPNNVPGTKEDNFVNMQRHLQLAIAEMRSELLRTDNGDATTLTVSTSRANTQANVDRCCKMCGCSQDAGDVIASVQRLEERLVVMETRLTRMVNARFEDLDERISKRFGDLEDKLRSLKKSVDFG